MKKFLSLVLALLMVVSCASLVGAAETPAIEDTAVETTAVAATEGQYDFAIKFLESYGIYKGTSATEFVADAESEIQRYQMALFVARISTGWVDDSKWAVYDEWHDGPETRNENRSTFDDLAGTYAEKVYGAISYAAQKGIIEGYGNNKFGPTDGITYQNALTMIVRTLGYKNLAWPWGYIEKAVTLGLTKGIPSTIAYTDVLNRGAVAQLIYNALFAETKEGDTLAARNFNGGLGWSNVIITIAGRGRLLPDDDTKVPSSGPDKTYIIGFRVVNEDGTLGTTTYFFKTNEVPEFGVTKHPERYLGHAYKCLFTTDENSAFVNVVKLSVKSLLDDDGDGDLYTVWNKGRLAKTADGEYPIYAYLKNYTLVSKFNKNTYLNSWNGGYGYGEYILLNGINGVKITYVSDEHRYGINWITGDIIEKVAKASDADVYETDGKTLMKVGDWYFKTAWHYNELLGVYFKYVYKDTANGVELVGIDILDKADVEALLDKQYIEKEKTTATGYAVITGDIPGKTAYASLSSFILNDFNTPDYGIYEEYMLGQYTEASIKCTSCDADKAGFKMKGLDAVAKQIWKGADDLLSPEKKLDFAKEDFPDLFDDADWGKFTRHSGIFEGSCDHGTAWFSEDGLTPANGDYVIYNYDATTGELKIVKIIYDINSEKADKNNFIANGVVRAYNVPNKTITIGDTQYSFDYPELLGLGLRLDDGDGKLLARAAFTYMFKSMFNQYVKYVVCDGKIVWIELAGNNKNLIVVDSYAGLSSDGYIVVNGYKTDELLYKQFRIGSYNGWVKGDYFYYPNNAEVDKAFYRGTLYQIQSYDKNEDVYYVNTIALKPITRTYNRDELNELKGTFGVNAAGFPETYSWSFMDYDYDELIEKGIIKKQMYGIQGQATAGYYKKAYYNPGAATWGNYLAETAKSEDRYVLICNPIWNFYGWSNGDDGTPDPFFGTTAHDLEDNYTSWFTGGDYAPIIVYTGKIRANWFVEGYRVEDLGSNVYVMLNVNFQDVLGFDKDQYDLSYVLFLTYDYETAAYDGADQDGWYLLGASNYTARVFNFYNGDVETRIATNKDLKKGFAYPSINGVIVNDVRYDARRLNLAIPGAYLSGRKYRFGHGTVGAFANWTDKDGNARKGWEVLFRAEGTSRFILSDTFNYNFQALDLTTETSVFLVSTETLTSGLVRITEVNKVSADEFKDWLRINGYDTATMYYWFIHTVKGETVFYIEKDGNKITTIDPWTLPTSNLLDFSNTINGVPNHAYVEGVFGGIAHQITDENGASGLIDARIDTLSFEWIGPATYDTHEAVDTNDFHFGHPGYCVQEDWETMVTVDFGGGNVQQFRTYGSIFEEEYDPQDYDLTHCHLVKKVNLDFSKLVPVDTAATPVNLADDTTETGTALMALPQLDATGAPISPITITIDYQDSCFNRYEFVIEIYTVLGPVVAGYQTYQFMALFSDNSQMLAIGKDYGRDYPVDATLYNCNTNILSGGIANIPLINKQGAIDIRTGAAFPAPYAVKPY